MAPLFLSGELSPLVMLVSAVAIIASWFAEPPRYPAERFNTTWNIVSLLFLVFLVIRGFRGESIIVAGIEFLLLVLVNKLFNRRTSKDYQQVYVITLLMLVAGTTLNTGLSYAVSLFLYVLFATWSLTLVQLRREVESNSLIKHSGDSQSEKVEVQRILRSRRVVGKAFFGGTALLSLGMVVGASLIFTLFPRIGFGLFSGPRRQGIAMAGFSDRVELGHHGTIRDNPRVVMRVVFDGAADQQTKQEALRWRGSVFDRYERGTWSHSPDLLGRTVAVSPKDGLYHLNYAPGMPPNADAAHVRAHTLRQQIYLEPLDTPVLFAADRPVAMGVVPTKVGQLHPFVPRQGPLGEIRAARRRTAGVRYWAYSKLYEPTGALLRRARKLNHRRLRRFVQLPPELPERVVRLAQRITAQHTSLYDKVRAVARHLQANYQYTTALDHTPTHEPVDEFLFETRKGHCEYFASAMALLLRGVGIHTRHVNGFVGGQWNDYGNYLAVRQGDAHAWTEVLFSNVGWIAFDATPARSRPQADAAGGLLHKAGQLLDAVRLRWFTYVVEYDLEKQVRMVSRIGAALKGRGKLVHHRQWTPAPVAWIAVGLGLLCLVTILWWLRRRHRVRRSSPQRGLAASKTHPATVLYDKALRLLESRKLAKPPERTPREFADQLGREGYRVAPTIATLTNRYYAARFCDASWTVDQHTELVRLVSQLKRLLEAESSQGAKDEGRPVPG